MPETERKPLRVVLIGAESTGKTTLAAQLAVLFDTVWAPEYLRAFVREKGALPEPEDSRRIADGHLAQERLLLRRARRVLFLDTDLISTLVYHRHYFGASPEWLKRKARVQAGDLYLLADTDIPWTADPGQRSGPAVREELQILFRRELVARGLSHVVVSGCPESRLEAAADAVRRRLALRQRMS